MQVYLLCTVHFHSFVARVLFPRNMYTLHVCLRNCVCVCVCVCVCIGMNVCALLVHVHVCLSVSRCACVCMCMFV